MDKPLYSLYIVVYQCASVVSSSYPTAAPRALPGLFAPSLRNALRAVARLRRYRRSPRTPTLGSVVSGRNVEEDRRFLLCHVAFFALLDRCGLIDYCPPHGIHHDI